MDTPEITLEEIYVSAEVGREGTRPNAAVTNPLPTIPKRHAQPLSYAVSQLDQEQYPRASNASSCSDQQFDQQGSRQLHKKTEK